MSKILGIDLGTTFSAMATMEGGKPKILENAEGSRTTPSVVALSKDDERLVGVVARRQAITNPKNTISSVKRLIGRKFSDEQVQKDKKELSYEIKEKSEDGGVQVKMGEKWYTPQEISAMILQKMKQDAEEKLGEKIEEAIITCPAYFDDSQRKATKVAGEIAGLKVKRVINEPTAAALAYGLDKKNNRQIVVYDFGGGTFDVSILDVSEDTVEVKATGGNSHLGGEDFDNKIMQWVIDKFKKDEGIDLSKDTLALQRIKEAAEKAKIELSTAQKTEINLPFITSDSSGPRHLQYNLSRAEFENMTQDLVDKSIDLVKQTLKEGNINAGDVEEIVLVGGQTRSPAIQNKIKEVFGKDPNKEINPDEVVAIGAAVQGGIMQGEVKDVLLLDVTPLSLGIETLGGVNTSIISKNTTIPASETQTFSTAADNQTSVEINVLQGERPMAKDNKSLGKFILDGIPPAPRGVPQVEVKFDIDANGILNVSAKDKGSGKSQSIRIEGSTGLSKEEVEKMKKEAESHAEEDKKKKELIDARNKAENLVFTTEKTLRDSGDKISEDSKKDLQGKLDELKKTKDGEDKTEIENKTNELSQKLQEVGSQIYQNQGGGQGEEQGANQGQNNENTSDSSEEKGAQEGQVDEDENKEGDKDKNNQQGKNEGEGDQGNQGDQQKQ